MRAAQQKRSVALEFDRKCAVGAVSPQEADVNEFAVRADFSEEGVRLTAAVTLLESVGRGGEIRGHRQARHVDVSTQARCNRKRAVVSASRQQHAPLNGVELRSQLDDIGVHGVVGVWLGPGNARQVQRGGVAGEVDVSLAVCCHRVAVIGSAAAHVRSQPWGGFWL